MAQTLEAIFYRGDNQDRIDHTPSGALGVGEVVDLGAIIGIVTSPEGIAANTLGSLATKGTFKLKKVPADTIAYSVIGEAVYFNVSSNKVVATSGANVVVAGRLEEAALAADDHVKCAINEWPLQDYTTTTTTTTTT